MKTLNVTKMKGCVGSLFITLTFFLMVSPFVKGEDPCVIPNDGSVDCKVLPGKYNYIGSFYKGLAKVQFLNGEWGLINTAGDALPGKYNYIGSFYEGLAKLANRKSKCNF